MQIIHIIYMFNYNENNNKYNPNNCWILSDFLIEIDYYLVIKL